MYGNWVGKARTSWCESRLPYAGKEDDLDVGTHVSLSREYQGVREVIPHIGPIPIIIPLTLFLEGIDFPRMMLSHALRGKTEGFLNMGRKEKRLDSSNLWFIFWFI